MTKEEFYQTLARYVQSEGYAQGADSEAMLRSIKLPLWASVAVNALFGAQAAVYAASADISVGASKTAALEAEFHPMLPFTPVVLFKFILGGIIVLSVVEADELSDQNILAAAKTFDVGLLNATKYVAQRGLLWKQQAAPVTGTLLFVFWDSDKAAHFHTTLQSHCDTRHFRKMTHLFSLAVDVPNRRVLSRERMRFMQSFADNRLSKKLFGIQSA
jgi:hypothetical protein